MKQDINLYQPRFRPQRLWLSARQLLALLIGLAVLLALAGIHLQRQQAAAEQRAAQLQRERETLQADLARLQKQLDARLADRQWARREARLRKQLESYQRLLDYVSEQRFGDGEGFSAPLLALSGARVPDVWLERIRLSGQDIRLQGAALRAADIPRYFAGLRQLKVFAERAFEDFRIQRSSRYDWKLEFDAATRVKKDD
jgi:Tfp pilus assembly protein PilN